MEAKAKRLSKYSTMGLSAMLVMAFVLVQPTIQIAYAVGIEGLPSYDDCGDRDLSEIEDPISMNTVRSGNIVKTVHAEKEIFDCHLTQGHLEVIVDLTTYLEVYENIVTQEVIETSAFSITCIKDELTATVIDCESKPISSSPVFVGSDCREADPGPSHRQEMNTVNKGKLAKTVEAQKEVFYCSPLSSGSILKKIDIVLFTEIYEDLNTQTTTSVQFLSARCVVLAYDGAEGDMQDASVESCTFTEIEN